MTNENDEDSLFIGFDPAENGADDAVEPDQDSEVVCQSEAHEFAEQEKEAVAALSEELYRYGPAASTGRRGKRKVGRPTSQEAAREKTRLRVERWRARQITGIQKTWQQNLAALSEEERAKLLNQQRECDDLMVQMNHCLHGIGYGTGKGMTGENMPLPELVYSRVKEFISQPGRGLVQFWAPSGVVNDLDPEVWEQCDDPDFARYGIRTRLVKLFFREFLRHIHRWIETQTPDVDSMVAEEIATLLAGLDPPKEGKYIPEPTPFVSESERERRIEEKKIVEEYRAREIATFEKWQAKQLG